VCPPLRDDGSPGRQGAKLLTQAADELESSMVS
jgi:hypothetical protein